MRVVPALRGRGSTFQLTPLWPGEAWNRQSGSGGCYRLGEWREGSYVRAFGAWFCGDFG
jgi:hypothetical protein